jgi:hypothetical protein
MRRVLGLLFLATTLGLAIQPAAAAAAPRPKQLTLTTTTVTIVAPDAPATVCDYNELHCGYINISATFSGLNKFPRPAGPAGFLQGSVDVTRVYGCQSAAGKRLHRYDTRVSGTEGLNSRRGQPFLVPPTGDTLATNTYAFLTDRQPGNCPTGLTPMIYRIVATNVRLELVSNSEIPSGTYKAPYRAQWIGAVPNPTPAAS